MNTLVRDVRYSYYQLLAKKLLEGNQMFSVARSNRGDCYTGRASHQTQWNVFKTWANSTAKGLRSYTGNLVPIDTSLLNGFPETRPPMCMPLDKIRIMLDKDGFKTNDPKENVVRSNDGNVTHDWTRTYYWKAKKRDYYIMKDKIDKKLTLLEEQQRLTKFDSVLKETERWVTYKGKPIKVLLPTMDIEKPVIESKPIIQPEIIAASSLIPIGIIGILLLNSRRGKK